MACGALSTGPLSSLADDTGNAGNAWREVDFEVARWGNGGDPTGMQYVLRPLQSGGMPPKWRVRFPVSTTPHVWMGSGGGSGACNQQVCE